MTGASIVKSPAGEVTRLIVSGGWSTEAAAHVAESHFDGLEFHGGEYANFRFLKPCAAKITSLSILSGTWLSADGLEDLTSLRSLNIGPQLKGVDFSALTRLETLGLGAWTSGYAKTLFDCRFLKWLHIEGFGGTTCENIGRLKQLVGLSLARGSLTSLAGLSGCAWLRAIQLAHLRKLNDIVDIGALGAIREIELVENLPLIRDIRSVIGREEVRRLDLRGFDGQFDDISWLRNMAHLNVLGLRNVVSLDWQSLFASRVLKKVA
ncbi:MAG TPA: hypothetical protein VFS41_01075, partial [Edaphobacter sp.]|nr:hypothetical protein [Edaphobacter sp.]